MTYSSTNLRLTYDNNTNQWNYTEADYEYANPTPPTWSGYTSSDPDFKFAPEVPDTNQPPSQDPCPAGYIYDNTLKQCVPDPNYAPRQWMNEPTGGGNDNPQAEFVEFDSSTTEGRKAMYEHGLENGYFTPDAMAGDTSKGGAYEIAGPPETKVWGFMKPLAQFGEDRQYNRWINELNKLNNERLAEGKPAVLAQAIGFFGLSKTFNDWTNYANNINVHSDVEDIGKEEITSVTGESTVDLEKEKAKKIAEKKQAEADIAKMDALEKEQSLTDDKGDTYTKVTDNQTGGGGSQGYSFTPSDPKPVENKPYNIPGGGGTVMVGPRAGVMAPKKENTGYTPGGHHF
tara:strand:+ start:61 stop:1092 length:1032 start_codon:yes stop_codon:yes gene_type:complete